jgi:hypothetical protein
MIPSLIVQNVGRSSTSRIRRWRALLACGGLLLAAGKARADGAFPDSENVMTPAALPNEIVLATNFGVVLSIDAGQTWTWTCEQTQNAYGSLYQIGPAPMNRLYAVAMAGLVYSDDSSCTWKVAGGVIAGTSVLDAFVDPTDPTRMLAIVARAGDGGSTFQVYESTDAGATFGTLLYTAADGDHLTGVEIARSAPTTVYLTMTSGPTYLPKLVRSTNSGATWQAQDLSAMLNTGITSLRLIAVDPQDPQRVFMRVSDTAGEQVAVTTDGGATISAQLAFPGGIVAAFARMPTSGHLVVGGVVGVAPVEYLSTDNGATFQALAVQNPPSLRALSARGRTM